MRLIRNALVLVCLVLGLAVVLDTAWFERECAPGGAFDRGWAARFCGTPPELAVETVPPRREPGAGSRPPTSRSVRAAEPGPVAALRDGPDRHVRPSVVLPAQSAQRLAPSGLPFSEPIGEPAAHLPELAQADARSPGPAVPAPAAADPMAAAGIAAPAALVAVPIRPTTVPVPRDPGQEQRLLDASYPATLRAMGAGGTVVLALRIDARGRVRNPAIVSGSGYDALDAAALDVARALRFTPARQDGRSVETRILHPLVFSP